MCLAQMRSFLSRSRSQHQRIKHFQIKSKSKILRRVGKVKNKNKNVMKETCELGLMDIEHEQNKSNKFRYKMNASEWNERAEKREL